MEYNRNGVCICKSCIQLRSHYWYKNCEKITKFTFFFFSSSLPDTGLCLVGSRHPQLPPLTVPHPISVFQRPPANYKPSSESVRWFSVILIGPRREKGRGSWVQHVCRRMRLNYWKASPWKINKLYILYLHQVVKMYKNILLTVLYIYLKLNVLVFVVDAGAV